MVILITCIRAPISIEWVKIAHKSGHKVIGVDSLSFPIGKLFQKIEYVKIPSPVIDINNYKNQMKLLLEKSDMVIPNCEDIFYLIELYDEFKDKIKFLLPNKELLFKLHNKYDYLETLNNFVKLPKTKLLTNKKDILINKETILKPVYSRFGRDVIMDISIEKIDKIKVSNKIKWIQQEKIIGFPICNYAICEKGKVISHVIYKPMYLLNGAAATYFREYYDKRIEKFINKFVKDNNYNGQIAFDFIDNGNDIYILECNPRATSGLHILNEEITIDEDLKILYNNNNDKKDVYKSYRTGISLFLLFSFSSILKGNFKTLIEDFINSKNVFLGIKVKNQLLSLFEMIYRSFKFKKSITEASTFDIEYDYDK